MSGEAVREERNACVEAVVRHSIPLAGGETAHVHSDVPVNPPNDPKHRKYQHHHEGHARPILVGDERKHAKSVSNTPHTEQEEDCEEAESPDHLVVTAAAAVAAHVGAVY